MRAVALLGLTAVLTLPTGAAASATWRSFGGPNGDFTIADAALPAAWPAGGPNVAWRRELGTGHSGVLADGKRLYTQYAEGVAERVVALAADSGETLWTHECEADYDAGFPDRQGPHATPLLTDGRLFTLGVLGRLHAFDADSGGLLWKTDLMSDFGARRPQAGFASSPVAFGDLVILQVGGSDGRGVVAWRQATGEIAWARHDVELSHATPIFIDLDGETQLVFHLRRAVMGIDPGSGRLLWRMALPDHGGNNVAFTPLWLPERRLLVLSYPYGSRYGGRALELSRVGGETRVVERWRNGRFRVEHTNAVAVDGTIVATVGSDPHFLVGLDAASGEERWRQRFARSTFLRVGDRLLALNEDGDLMLARLGADGLAVEGRHRVLTYNAWTAPTWSGGRLYLRDLQHLVAIDVTAGSAVSRHE